MSELSPQLLRFGAIASIGVTAVTGCAVGNVNYVYIRPRILSNVDKGVVIGGANVYFDPTVTNDNSTGYVNKCALSKLPVNLAGKHIVEPLNNTDPNGRFTGFFIDELPKAVQNDCRDDKDGFVWVKSIYTAGITKANSRLLPDNIPVE